jgi:hypothetical protein
MDKIMVNSDKYNGQYVAIKSAEDNSIIGSGNTPEDALNQAKGNGFETPFLIYVPEENLVHIYCAG